MNQYRSSVTSGVGATRQVRSSWLVAGAVVVAVVAFMAGVHHQRLLAMVAPLVGQAVVADTLDLATVQQTYQRLLQEYDGTVETQALIDGANRGLVAATGDPYTTYMNAEEAEKFEKDLSGDIGGGIGAEIGVRNQKITIIRALPGNPAQAAGLKAGDVIQAVNNTPIEHQTVDEVVAQIRGQAGTTVKLVVSRDNTPREVVVTRAQVNNPSIETARHGNIGVIRMSRFDAGTASRARAAADNFKREGIGGLVLDLRGNGGGLLDAARSVAGLWLDNRVVVTERKGDRVVDELRSEGNPPLAGVPTVVLVNGGSASASEIVAGALQDHGVARVIGEKTFGKGSVQTIVNLADGARLKVTIAKWYTPQGRTIDRTGITPDQAVALTQTDSDAGRDPQLDAALAHLGQRPQ